jgi:hypothetical protein
MVARARRCCRLPTQKPAGMTRESLRLSEVVRRRPKVYGAARVTPTQTGQTETAAVVLRSAGGGGPACTGVLWYSAARRSSLKVLPPQV